MIPFAAYMLAEELEASGVLAVVTAGFLVGQLSVRFGYETRLQERQVWGAVDVLLEAFVFAYMGLQLRFVIEDLGDAGASASTVFGAGVLVLSAVIVIRPVVLFLTLGAGLVVEDRPDDPGILRAQRRFAEMNARAVARGRRPRPAHHLPEPLTLREAVVVSWTGMRGVVTVAAAAGVPATVPGRPEIQAIAYLVAVGTLLIQGATLPWLIRGWACRTRPRRSGRASSAAPPSWSSAAPRPTCSGRSSPTRRRASTRSSSSRLPALRAPSRGTRGDAANGRRAPQGAAGRAMTDLTREVIGRAACRTRRRDPHRRGRRRGGTRAARRGRPPGGGDRLAVPATGSRRLRRRRRGEALAAADQRARRRGGRRRGP